MVSEYVCLANTVPLSNYYFDLLLDKNFFALLSKMNKNRLILKEMFLFLKILLLYIHGGFM